MKLLLDTHTWFWSLQSPERLGPECRKQLADSCHELYVATVSTLELAQLVYIGRIHLRGRSTTGSAGVWPSCQHRPVS